MIDFENCFFFVKKYFKRCAMSWILDSWRDLSITNYVFINFLMWRCDIRIFFTFKLFSHKRMMSSVIKWRIDKWEAIIHKLSKCVKSHDHCDQIKKYIFTICKGQYFDVFSSIKCHLYLLSIYLFNCFGTCFNICSILKSKPITSKFRAIQYVALVLKM